MLWFQRLYYLVLLFLFSMALNPVVLCRLYIKQPPSSTSISGYEEEEPEWAEYKIKETNMFTVDKYQQVIVFVLFLVQTWQVYAFALMTLLVSSWMCFMISLQIGFFPNEKAFSLRYQTAGMLESVLRQGVLGEDDTGEESPKSVFLSLEGFIFFLAWTSIIYRMRIRLVHSFTLAHQQIHVCSCQVVHSQFVLPTWHNYHMITCHTTQVWFPNS